MTRREAVNLYMFVAVLSVIVGAITAACLGPL